MSRHPSRKASSDVFNSRRSSNDQQSIRLPEHITLLTSPKRRNRCKIGRACYNGSESFIKGSRVAREQSNRKLQMRTPLMHSTSLPSFLSIQEAEFCELESFLSTYRYQKSCTPAAVKIQSTWRMYKKKKAYRKWAKYVEKRYRKLFKRWALSAKVGRVLRRSVQRKFIEAWRNQVKSTLRVHF
uniref:AlNc14C185G8309 protein n=1 Tax=Albugo laibachii Nc14 TaxID=890382 RepID=F0WPG4_9STRA|nr:AlNc14C185G8309 [Albugo laibachii Nc14]|eukprot:CCA23212.1 AlNc14C185G8309 [Albugo laibachii Nc14]